MYHDVVVSIYLQSLECVYNVHRKSITKNLYIEYLDIIYVAMIFLCKNFGYRFLKRGRGFCFGLYSVSYAFLPHSLCDNMKKYFIIVYYIALLTQFT